MQESLTQSGNVATWEELRSNLADVDAREFHAKWQRGDVGKTSFMADTHLELIAKNVLDIAFRIHTKFGPGLLESVYKMMLYHELVKMGYKVDVEKAVSFEFEGHCYENAFRADLIIDDCFIVETKSTELMHPVYGKQLKTYLTLMDMRLGLLLNFGMASLKDGIERVVNKYY